MKSLFQGVALIITISQNQINHFAIFHDLFHQPLFWLFLSFSLPLSISLLVCHMASTWACLPWNDATVGFSRNVSNAPTVLNHVYWIIDTGFNKQSLLMNIIQTFNRVKISQESRGNEGQSNKNGLTKNEQGSRRRWWMRWAQTWKQLDIVEKRRRRLEIEVLRVDGEKGMPKEIYSDIQTWKRCLRFDSEIDKPRKDWKTWQNWSWLVVTNLKYLSKSLRMKQNATLVTLGSWSMEKQPVWE